MQIDIERVDRTRAGRNQPDDEVLRRVGRVHQIEGRERLFRNDQRFLQQRLAPDEGCCSGQKSESLNFIYLSQLCFNFLHKISRDWVLSQKQKKKLIQVYLLEK